MTTEERQVEALLSEGDSEETLGGFSIEIRRARIQRERIAQSEHDVPFPGGELRKAADIVRPIFLKLVAKREQRLSSAQARDLTCFLHSHGRSHDWFLAGLLEEEGYRVGITPLGGFSIVSDRALAPNESDLKALIELGKIPVCVGSGPFSKPEREDESHSVVLNSLRELGLEQDPVWNPIGRWQHSAFTKGGPGSWTRTLGMVRTVSLGHMSRQTAVYRFHQTLIDAIRAEIVAGFADTDYRQLRAGLSDQTSKLGVWLGIEQHPIWQRLLEASSASWENTVGAITTLCLALFEESVQARELVLMILDSVQAELEEEDTARQELAKVRVYPRALMHNGRSVTFGTVETDAVLIPRLARKQGIEVLVRINSTNHVIISSGRGIDLSRVVANLRRREAQLANQPLPANLYQTGLVDQNDVWYYKRGQRRFMFESLINGGFTHPGMRPTAIQLEDLAWLTFEGLREK